MPVKPIYPDQDLSWFHYRCTDCGWEPWPRVGGWDNWDHSCLVRRLLLWLGWALDSSWRL